MGNAASECIRCSPWHLTWAPWHLIRKEARQRAKEIPRGPLRSLVVHVYFLWSGPNCQAKDFITPERRRKNVFAISKPLKGKKENSLLVVWCTFTIILALSKWSFNFHQRAALRGDGALSQGTLRWWVLIKLFIESEELLHSTRERGCNRFLCLRFNILGKLQNSLGADGESHEQTAQRLTNCSPNAAPRKMELKWM